MKFEIYTQGEVVVEGNTLDSVKHLKWVAYKDVQKLLSKIEDLEKSKYRYKFVSEVCINCPSLGVDIKGYEESSCCDGYFGGKRCENFLNHATILKGR